MPGPFANRSAVKLAEEYRSQITKAMDAEDWPGAYQWAKGWIGSGSGAGCVEPWLVYVAATLMQGHKRTAVRSCDLALKSWIEGPEQRAVIRYSRGEVIRRHLADPRSAQADLDAAVADAPDWLRPLAGAAAEACRKAHSGRRKPTAEPAPELEDRRRSRTPKALRSVAQPPPLWAATHAILTRR